jgi:hypothetical protein
VLALWKAESEKLAVYGLFSVVKSQGLDVGPEGTHTHQHTLTDGW